MSREDYVKRALDARVEQGLPRYIEDPATLDYLVDVLTHPGRQSGRQGSLRAARPGDGPNETAPAPSGPRGAQERPLCEPDGDEEEQ